MFGSAMERGCLGFSSSVCVAGTSLGGMLSIICGAVYRDAKLIISIDAPYHIF